MIQYITNGLNYLWETFKHRIISLTSGFGGFGISLVETVDTVAWLIKQLGVMAAGVVAIWSAYLYFRNLYRKKRQAVKK